MKQLLCNIAASVYLLTGVCTAQTPDYNLDFENWDAASLQRDTLAFSLFPSMHQVKEPYSGWPEKWVKNSFGRRMLRTTDAFSGKYAAVLYEWYNGASNSLVLGDCYDQFFKAGDTCMVKYPRKVYGVSGYYKYYPDSFIPGVPWLIVKTYYTDTLLHKGRISTVDSFAFKPKDAYGYFNLYIKSVLANIPDSFSVRFDINTNGMGISIYQYANFLYLDGLQFHYVPYTALKTESIPLKKSAVKLYPNPAQSVFYLSTPEQADVQVYDNTGRIVQVYWGVVNGQALSTGCMKPGLYLVKVIGRAEVSYMKLQVE